MNHREDQRRRDASIQRFQPDVAKGAKLRICLAYDSHPTSCVHRAVTYKAQDEPVALCFRSLRWGLLFAHDANLGQASARRAL